jgi:hypothetical protein
MPLLLGRWYSRGDSYIDPEFEQLEANFTAGPPRLCLAF